MIFPSKYSLLATTRRNCVHYISPECGASTLHSPVAMPMVSAGRCPVGSGLQWSRCDLLHFYRPVIRQAHHTTPAHHHTGISSAYGGIYYYKRCVPLVPVDYKTDPLPLPSQVCQLLFPGAQTTNKPPPGHCIINLLSTAPAAAFLVIKAGESFVFERYF